MRPDLTGLRMAAIHMMAGSIGGLRFFDETVRYEPLPEEKPCLECGKMKQHNNDFCSRECCHAYRKRRKR